MKKIVFFVAFLMASWGAPAQAQLHDLASDSFVRDGVKYAIKVQYREISSIYTGEDHQLQYAITVNGKFLHRQNSDGGYLGGCRYEKKFDLPTLTAINSKHGQIGWLLQTRGSCGAHTSINAQLIVMPKDPAFNGYSVKTFNSKVTPLFSASADGKVHMVYGYQEYGDGAMSMGFVVPVFISIDPSATYYNLMQEEKPKSDLKTWPKFAEYNYTVASYLVAGINYCEPQIIRAASAMLNKEEVEHLKAVGLPSTKAEIYSLADGIEKVGKQITNFYRKW